MTRARVSVVKVGGSLLATAELPKRLRTWLATESAAHRDTHFVLVAGGGKWVDAIRAIDVQTPLGDERAHWICAALMDVTIGLVGAMLSEQFVAKSFAELEGRLRESGITLLCPRQFLADIEPTRAGTRLAHDWSVTSDAIAGRLAIVLDADELVLLKSADPPVPSESDDWIARLAVAGYVDAFLPKLSAELPELRCIACF